MIILLKILIIYGILCLLAAPFIFVFCRAAGVADEQADEIYRNLRKQ